MASIEPSVFTWVTRADGSRRKKAAPDSRWRARYRSPDGKSREKWFDRQVDAKQFITSLDHSVLTNTYVDPRAGKVTVGEYAEQWRSRQVWRDTTAAQVQTNMRRHLVGSQLGSRSIGAVRPSEVQAWVKGLSATLAPATTELIYRYLVTIYRAAVADRLVQSSPCVGVKLPKVERHQVVPLTIDQVHAFTEAMPLRYRAMVTLAAGTGLRQGECLGLTVDRVNFLRRQVVVDRQLVLVTGAPRLGPPKTPASYRTVPLPAVVVDALAAHLAEYPAGADGFIFTNDQGDPIRRTRYSDAVRKARAPAGLPDHVTFHDLRHFYASLLIRKGCSVKVVQNRLGHANAAETLDTYSHLWPDDEDRTRDAVDDVFRTSRGVGVGLGLSGSA